MVSTFALVVSYSSKRIRVEAPVVYLVVCRVSALVVGYSLVKTSSSSNIDRLDCIISLFSVLRSSLHMDCTFFCAQKKHFTHACCSFSMGNV